MQLYCAELWFSKNAVKATLRKQILCASEQLQILYNWEIDLKKDT